MYIYLGQPLSTVWLQRLGDKSWLRQNATEIYKDEINLVARLTLPLNKKDQTVLVKNFGWRNMLSQLLSPLMRSRAQLDWDASHDLLKIGVKVPAPLGVFTRRSWGFVRQNFTITEHVPQAVRVRKLLRDDQVSWEKKQEIVGEIAKMVTKLHARGWLHNDLTRGNFLASRADARPLYLIDLNRAKPQRRLSAVRRMRDVARINLCRCDLQECHADCLWQTFLEHYAVGERQKNSLRLTRALYRNRWRLRLKKQKRQLRQEILQRIR